MTLAPGHPPQSQATPRVRTGTGGGQAAQSRAWEGREASRDSNQLLSLSSPARPRENCATKSLGVQARTPASCLEIFRFNLWVPVNWLIVDKVRSVSRTDRRCLGMRTTTYVPRSPPKRARGLSQREQVAFYAVNPLALIRVRHGRSLLREDSFMCVLNCLVILRVKFTTPSSQEWSDSFFAFFPILSNLTVFSIVIAILNLTYSRF